jgi:large subunit ribosomal protein L5
MAKEEKDKQAKGGGGGGGGPKGPKGGKPTEAEIAARKAAKRAKTDQQDDAADDAPAVPAPPPRLIEHYQTKVVPELKQKFGFKNNLAVPRLEKIVISMGVGKYATLGGEGKAKFDQAEKELGVIAGQRPVRCKAKKSVANFKVREGMETGLKVMLRGARMWEFLDRLITLAIPRVKDFRGMSPTGFDKSGNYNFGFNEQTVFPEVDGAAVTFQQGMNITIVSTAGNAEEGRELLKQFGFPFRVEEVKESKQKTA